jgi:hypothetical protein
VVKLRHHAVVAARRGQERVGASIGPDGQLIALWAAARDLPALKATTTQPGWATFPDPRAPRPVRARVSIHAPELISVVELAELPLAHVTVQPLPQGQILVVGARARWRPEGPDRNAIIYDADGGVAAKGTLGDGIKHVLTTDVGDIWVGYFDEGVYGNFGWGGKDGPAPIGHHGLVRFSSRLETEWSFPSHIDQPWGAIGDCYALNVDKDTVWTCYDTDFPIVRICDGALAVWRSSITGARALVAAGSDLASVGGYGPDRDLLAVGTLGSEDLHLTGRYRIVLPDGQPLPERTQVIGRGPDLHFLAGRDWYRLDLEHVPASPGRPQISGDGRITARSAERASDVSPRGGSARTGRARRAWGCGRRSRSA